MCNGMSSQHRKQSADFAKWRWQRERYVSIKLSNGSRDQKAIEHEWEMAIQVLTADPSYRGKAVVRKVVKTFGIDSYRGTQLCSVYTPLRETFGSTSNDSWIIAYRYLLSKPMPTACWLDSAISIQSEILFTQLDCSSSLLCFRYW
jgi:hypothetical protein